MSEYTYSDVDGDGYRETGMADTNANNLVDNYSFDTNRDGYSEAVGFDLNENGVIDYIDVDTDRDGTTDTRMVDTNGNGLMDQATGPLTGNVTVAVPEGAQGGPGVIGGGGHVGGGGTAIGGGYVGGGSTVIGGGGSHPLINETIMSDPYGRMMVDRILESERRTVDNIIGLGDDHDHH